MRVDSADPATPAPRISQHHHIIEIARIKPTVLRGVLLLMETVVVPTLLLYAFTNTVGSLWGLVAVLGWCTLTVGARLTMRQRVPSTLVLAVGGLVGRTTIALIFSNVYVYLFQPIVGSLFMAALFLGSAAIGRPVTARLAQDFVALPSHLFHDRRVRRIFINVSLIWGLSRLIDVGMSLGSLHFGVGAGLLSRGVLSTALTISTIAICAWWGWRRMSRVPGVSFRFA
ncbi:MAG TPA: hypothetical protein VFB19_07330 [Mycobacterium sp.]|nr:hypothetical protein [Mycobacterium sp.]